MFTELKIEDLIEGEGKAAVRRRFNHHPLPWFSRRWHRV